LALAEKCASASSLESSGQFLQIKPTLQDILRKSQNASPDLGQLFYIINFEKGMTQVKGMMDRHSRVDGDAQEPTE
jgi:hypothetical protein